MAQNHHVAGRPPTPQVAVCGFQPVENLSGNRQRLFDEQRTRTVQPVAEGLAVDEFHEDAIAIALAKGFVDPADVQMIDAPGKPHLGLEGTRAGMELLNGINPLRLQLLSLVDGTRPPTPDFIEKTQSACDPRESKFFERLKIARIINRYVINRG